MESKTPQDREVTEVVVTAKKPRKKARPRFSLKEEIFITEYLKGRNATDAAEKAYDISPHGKNPRKLAGSIASENLSKPRIKEEIMSRFKQMGFGVGDAVKIHARNILQSDHLPTSQKALETYYELVGIKGEAKTKTNIAFIVKD